MLAPHKTGETTADFTGKRVLLAEDNALNAEIAVELLQSIGLKVGWAEDGQKAMEMFEKSAPGSYFAIGFWEKHLRPLIQLNNSISGYKNYISKLYLTTY